MTIGGLLLASVTIPLVRAAGQSDRYPAPAFVFTYFAGWLFFLAIG